MPSNIDSAGHDRSIAMASGSKIEITNSQGLFFFLMTLWGVTFSMQGTMGFYKVSVCRGWSTTQLSKGDCNQPFARILMNTFFFEGCCNLWGKHYWRERLIDRMKCLMRWLRIWKTLCNLKRIKWLNLSHKEASCIFQFRFNLSKSNSLKFYIFGDGKDLGYFLFFQANVVWGVLNDKFHELDLREFT